MVVRPRGVEESPNINRLSCPTCENQTIENNGPFSELSNLPVRQETETPPEHEHSAAINEAAHWLAHTSENLKPRPVIPHLRARFGLSLPETIEAVSEAKRLRGENG